MITTRFFVLVCSLFFFSVSFAQKRQLPVDTLVVTNHKTTIKGTAVSYRAETGTQPVWNEKGQPIASLFYTYYRRTNVNNGTASVDLFIQWWPRIGFGVDACRLYWTPYIEN